MKISTEERFLRRVQKTDCGCWMWVGADDGRGYGLFRVKNRTVRAHRFSFAMFKRPLNDGELVRHRCDTPSCVNPDHLDAGSDKDNVRDAIERGRFKFRHAQPGEKHHKAKLTDDAIRDIRSERLSHTEFAKLYGVSRATIWSAQTGRGWRHVA